jgi:hypothetical protein
MIEWYKTYPRCPASGIRRLGGRTAALRPCPRPRPRQQQRPGPHPRPRPRPRPIHAHGRVHKRRRTPQAGLTHTAGASLHAHARTKQSQFPGWVNRPPNLRCHVSACLVTSGLGQGRGSGRGWRYPYNACPKVSFTQKQCHKGLRCGFHVQLRTMTKLACTFSHHPHRVYCSPAPAR